MIKYICLIFISLLLSCSNGQAEPENNEDSMVINEDPVVIIDELVKYKLGLELPEELKEFWKDKKNENSDALKIYDFPELKIIYPDVNDYVSFNNEKDSNNKIALYKNFIAADKLNKENNLKDYFYHNDDLDEWQVRYFGKHLSIRRTLLIGYSHNDQAEFLFYGFDATNKPLGIFYVSIQTMELPIYMGDTLQSVLEFADDAKNFDYDEFIKNNTKNFYDLRSEKQPVSDSGDVFAYSIKKGLPEFYNKISSEYFDEYKQFKVVASDSGWEVQFNSDFSIRLSAQGALPYSGDLAYDIIRLNRIINLQKSIYERPRRSTLQFIAGYGIAYLDEYQVAKFAKRGMLLHSHFILPLNVYLGPESNYKPESNLKGIFDESIKDSESYKNLSDDAKKEFDEDFGL